MIAHDDEGQTRKGSGARYWVHPQGVADLLQGYGVTDDTILCAAEIHDCVEDTAVTIDDIVELLDEKVAELVSEVTNSPDLDGLEKEEYMSRKLVNLTDDALTIKLGDMIYNTLDNPKKDQIERMKKNLEYLQHHRQIRKQLHRDLIETFYEAYKSKIKKF